MSVLDEILGKKKERLLHARSNTPLRELRERLRDVEGPRDFGRAVRRGDGAAINLIAEVKRASPSRGLIRADFNPSDIARAYDQRAQAISVITEEDFFGGSLNYISEVKAVTGRPVLRKDFLFDEYQIYEARAAGADAVLLIEAALERAQAGEYLHLASELGMAVLFEVHDLRGLEKALRVGAGIIGINNRDLRTLDIDLETTFELKKETPSDRTVVSESGISRREDVRRLEAGGVDAVLIGTSFMEAGDIGAKIEELFGGGN
jgi:indole-3-glycerol phosphate synthase